LGVNLDTSKGRSQESGVRSQEERRKKKEERRKKKIFLFPVPCSLFSDNSIEFNFVLYGLYQKLMIGLN
jgi:hypothetical protein